MKCSGAKDTASARPARSHGHRSVFFVFRSGIAAEAFRDSTTPSSISGSDPVCACATMLLVLVQALAGGELAAARHHHNEALGAPTSRLPLSARYAQRKAQRRATTPIWDLLLPLWQYIVFQIDRVIRWLSSRAPSRRRSVQEHVTQPSTPNVRSSHHTIRATADMLQAPPCAVLTGVGQRSIV